MDITVTTIALLALDDEVAVLLMMSKGTGADIYCIELDKASSLFVSPLYEHTLVLDNARRALSERASAVVGALPNPQLFSVAGWKQSKCLLEEDLSLATLPKRLRALLAHTLFVQSAATADPTGLFRQTYASARSSLVFCSSYLCAATYMKKFEQLRRDRKPRASPYPAFWDWVEERDGATLDHAINTLFHYVKKGARFPNHASVVKLLRGWPTPYRSLAGYVAHRLVQMPQILTLCRATRERADGLTGEAPPLLRQCVAFELFDASLSRDALLDDACRLVKFLWQLIETGPEQPDRETLLIHASIFANYESLIDAFLKERGRGGIGRLLNLLYLREFGRFRPHRHIVRRRLIARFIVPLVLMKVEFHAKNSSRTNRSTLEEVKLRVLYSAYCHLFRDGVKEAPEAAPAVFSLAVDEEAEWPEQSECTLFQFSAAEFNRCLSRLYRTLQDYTTSLPWKRREFDASVDTSTLEPTTTLFHIETQPVLLELERKIATHWQHHVLDEGLSLQLIDASTLDLERETLFATAATEDETVPFEKQRQQFRIVVFDPLALKQNRDIQLMKRLVKEDFYTTALLREDSTNHFFLTRLSSDFASVLDATQWKKELYFESTHFHQISRQAIRPQVIVGDCHFMTGDDLLSLLKWCHFHRGRVKRVVLIGSLDILPFAQHGQPFLDLLLKTPLERRQLRQRMFDAEANLARFTRLIEDEWRLIVWPRHGGTTKQRVGIINAVTADGASWLRRSLLFELATTDEVAMFVDTVRVSPHTMPLTLVHLFVDCPYERAKRLDFALSKKEQTRFRLVELDIENLMQHCHCVDEELFILSLATLRTLSKNHLSLIFSVVERLVVVRRTGEEEEEEEANDEQEERETLTATVVATFGRDRRPNMRYTSNSIVQQ